MGLLERFRRWVNHPCVTCGHPMHRHALEPPHPCQDCADDVMRPERCWKYVSPDARRTMGRG